MQYGSFQLTTHCIILLGTFHYHCPLPFCSGMRVTTVQHNTLRITQGLASYYSRAWCDFWPKWPSSQDCWLDTVGLEKHTEMNPWCGWYGCLIFKNNREHVLHVFSTYHSLNHKLWLLIKWASLTPVSVCHSSESCTYFLNGWQWLKINSEARTYQKII